MTCDFAGNRRASEVTQRLLTVLLAWISGDKVPHQTGGMEPRRVSAD